MAEEIVRKRLLKYMPLKNPERIIESVESFLQVAYKANRLDQCIEAAETILESAGKEFSKLAKLDGIDWVDIMFWRDSVDRYFTGLEYLIKHYNVEPPIASEQYCSKEVVEGLKNIIESYVGYRLNQSEAVERFSKYVDTFRVLKVQSVPDRYIGMVIRGIVEGNLIKRLKEKGFIQ